LGQFVANKAAGFKRIRSQGPGADMDEDYLTLKRVTTTMT